MTQPAEDLKTRVVRGGMAKAVTKAAALAIRIGSMMVVTRLLDPRDFGLVAMVSAVTGIFNLLRDAGLSRLTVQRENLTDAQLSTLFWVNVLVGVVLAAAFAACAPFLAAFYREPRLFWITLSLSLGFILNAVGIQHSALIQRQMRFTADAILDLLILVATTATAIAIAALGFGYWALVVASLMSPAVGSAGAWIIVRWVPGRPRRGVGLKSMMRFGGTVTLNNFLVYVAYNVDKVLLGRLAGAEALGMYGRAYQLVNIPTESLNSTVGGVAFSVLSRLQGDARRFRSYFLKGYTLVLTVTIPITIACAVLAEDVVVVALGRKWGHVAPLLRYLAPTILVFAIINPLSWLLYSRDLAGRSTRMAGVIAPVLIVAYAIGLVRGAAGVAVAFSTAMALLAIPLTAWAIHGTPVSLRDIFGAVRRPFLAGLSATIVTYLASPILEWFPFPILRLAVGSTVLFATYGWVLLYAMGQKAYYFDLLRVVSGRRQVDVAISG